MVLLNEDRFIIQFRALNGCWLGENTSKGKRKKEKEIK